MQNLASACFDMTKTKDQIEAQLEEAWRCLRWCEMVADDGVWSEDASITTSRYWKGVIEQLEDELEGME